MIEVIRSGNIESGLSKIEKNFEKNASSMRSELFYKQFSKYIKRLNYLSVDFLNSGEFISSFIVLHKCDAWT